jgi:hypothetical protein
MGSAPKKMNSRGISPFSVGFQSHSTPMAQRDGNSIYFNVVEV